jgi:hypothetical protein
MPGELDHATLITKDRATGDGARRINRKHGKIDLWIRKKLKAERFDERALSRTRDSSDADSK